jgi:proteasome alpha subunit
VIDERRLAVLGGDPETVADRLRPNVSDGMELGPALRAAVDALAGPERTLDATDLEVAVLSRTDARRAFRRVTDGELSDLLG